MLGDTEGLIELSVGIAADRPGVGPEEGNKLGSSVGSGEIGFSDGSGEPEGLSTPADWPKAKGGALLLGCFVGTGDGDVLSTDAGLPKSAGIELGTKEGTEDGLSVVVGLTNSSVGLKLGESVGSGDTDGLSSPAGWPKAKGGSLLLGCFVGEGDG